MCAPPKQKGRTKTTPTPPAALNIPGCVCGALRLLCRLCGALLQHRVNLAVLPLHVPGLFDFCKKRLSLACHRPQPFVQLLHLLLRLRTATWSPVEAGHGKTRQGRGSRAKEVLPSAGGTHLLLGRASQCVHVRRWTCGEGGSAAEEEGGWRGKKASACGGCACTCQWRRPQRCKLCLCLLHPGAEQCAVLKPSEGGGGG